MKEHLPVAPQVLVVVLAEEAELNLPEQRIEVWVTLANCQILHCDCCYNKIASRQSQSTWFSKFSPLKGEHALHRVDSCMYINIRLISQNMVITILNDLVVHITQGHSKAKILRKPY